MPQTYIQATINVPDKATQEHLIALLTDAGFDGFEQTADSLLAYTADDSNLALLKEICASFSCSCNTETLPVQNWNAVWESNFEPVVIPGFCAILAPFHEAVAGVPYEIRIMPKMSFGTGHHATTSLMLQQLQTMEVAGKKVLDFGAGTGILAIMAAKLGAAEITAIDNDEWAFENCLENAAANGAELLVQQGSLEVVGTQQFDIILANINRHILLKYMTALQQRLLPGGQLLLSGILTEDEPVITEAAQKAGFSFKSKKEKSNWLCICFTKNS